jgi:hypothetical protein
MADKQYVISASAVKPTGNGNATLANGANVIYAPNSEIANRAAMEFAKNNFKPSDGYIGHIAGAMEMPAEKVKPTFKFG